MELTIRDLSMLKQACRWNHPYAVIGGETGSPRRVLAQFSRQGPAHYFKQLHPELRGTVAFFTGRTWIIDVED